MGFNINQIVKEWSYRVHDGMPDIKNSLHMVQLRELLREYKITENEKKVGLSLIEVFENFEEIFVAGKGNKFNKNIILYELREMTGLTTKEIRMSLKRYKAIYYTIAPIFRNL